VELLSGSAARLTIVGLTFMLAAGCSGGAAQAPASLVDGSAARPPPVAFADVDAPAVATRVRVIDARSVPEGSRAAECIASFRMRQPGMLVERVGVTGESITAVSDDGRAAYACDGVGGAACGRASGRLGSGHLRDPRLSLSCVSGDGRPVAFAWVEPDPDARYIVVGQSGYVEVYPTAGDVPVRVTANHVDLETSSATFSVSEHDRNGGVLRSFELGAQVAG
jgi:hypothetical protein